MTAPPNRREPANGSSSTAAAVRALVVIGAVLVEPFGVAAALSAEDRATADDQVVTEPSVEKGQGGTPIATCRVKALKSNNAGPRYAANAVFIPTIEDDPLDDYRPHNSGNGPADPGDATLRLIIGEPGRQRRIDLRITIRGRSFRETRDRWIDGVLASRVSEADSPPAGDGPEAGGEQEEPAEADLGAMRRPRLRRPPTLRERVASHLEAVGDVDREELHLLLDRWSSGGDLIVLSEGRSWERWGVAPLLTLLDTNADGRLGPEEVAAAPQRLSRADIDEDGIVDLAEVGRKTEGRTLGMAPPPAPLVRVDDERSGAADLTFHVVFSPAADDRGRVELVAVDGVEPSVTAGDETLGLGFRPEYFEVTALATDGGVRDDQPESLSVGAVVDGYPLWRLIDLDGDNRLIAAEQRDLPGLLKQLDLDGDGELSADERPTAIRLAVGRGAIVHRLLEDHAPAAARPKPAEPSAPAPGWFVSMDRNGDRELSREEFAGSGTQFSAMDRDGDGFLSVSEVTGGGDTR